MSTPILPFAVWASGTNQNSVPANDNSLRNQILNGLVISDSTTAQPGSPAAGDIYIIPGSATGAQWSTFDEDDLAIFSDGTWYAFAPVEGVVVNLYDLQKQWLGGSNGWVSLGGGGSGSVESVVAGSGISVDNSDPANPIVSASGASPAPIVTHSTTNLDADGTNAGNYTRFTNAGGKTYTFDDAETFTVGDEYHGRNVGAGDLTLTEGGTMTLNAPAGGTLVVPQGGTFTVKIVASNEADVFGVTVAV